MVCLVGRDGAVADAETVARLQLGGLDIGPRVQIGMVVDAIFDSSMASVASTRALAPLGPNTFSGTGAGFITQWLVMMSFRSVM